VSVRRAFIALTVGQFAAVLAGYVTHVTLARVLGAAEYGDYGIVLNALSTVSLLIIAGLPEAVAKHAARRPEAALVIARRGIRLQAQLSVLLGVAYAVVSPLIAWIFRDPPLSPHLAVSAASIPAAALLAVAQGTFNAQRRFVAQALLIGGSAVTRMLAVVGLGLAFGLPGAIAGLVAAPIVMACIVIPGFRPWASPADAEVEDLASFARPVVVFTVALALLMNLDLFGIKILGLSPERLGHYTAAATIAKMPYLGLSALGVVLLPALSAASVNDGEARAVLRPAFRALLLGSLLITATLVPLAAPILGFLYGDAYVWSSLPLSILLCSGTLFTLFFVLSYALYGVSQPRIPTVLTLVGLVGEFVLLALLMKPFGATGAAAASCATSAVLLVGALSRARSVFGAIIPMKTAVRVSMAFAATVAIGSQLVGQDQLWLLFAPVLALSNLALLVISGETSVPELRRAVRRSAKPGQQGG
jgi:O-antigen/teichoic acid export membrane protein